MKMRPIIHSDHVLDALRRRKTAAAEPFTSLCDRSGLAIHEALDRLTAQAPLEAEVVKMRYFIGMRHGEIARALGVSEATVRRHWSFARAWLYAELKAQRER